MALGDVQPLIGSSFDALAGQRQYWAGLDAQIQAANIERALRQQQQQQNWMAQAADIAQRREDQNFQRQMDADAYARQLAVKQEDDATKARQRAEDIALGKSQFQQQMAYGKNYLDAQQKIAEDKIAASEKNKDLLLDSQGQHLAANYLGLQNAQQQTAQSLEDLHKQIDDVNSQLDTENSKSKKDQSKILRLNSTLKLYSGTLRQREADARKAESDLAKLENRAQNAKFEINDDGTITHPESTKTWNWKNALKAAKASAENPITTTGTTPLGPPAPDETGTTPWAGFATTSAAPQAPPPSALNPSPAAGAPGFLNGLGTSIGSLPPIAMVGRGFGNLVNPIVNPVRAAAPVAAQWFKDVAAPEIGAGVTGLGSMIGQGARNLVSPLLPNIPSQSLPQENAPAGPINLPTPPADPAQREVGRVYMTPAGPRRWMGNGWQQLT